MANTLAVLLYLLAAAVVIVLLLRLSAKARAAERQKAVQTVESKHDDLLLRFVNDREGIRVGETVAIDGTDLIVKDSQGFLAISVDTVQEDGKDLKLTSPLDEAGARERGEAWRERSHKVISYSESELPKDEPGA